VGGLFSGINALAAGPKRDSFKELRVRPFIKAAGAYTMLTASLMPPEVVQAWDYCARTYVNLDRLHDAEGQIKVSEFAELGKKHGKLIADSVSAVRGLTQRGEDESPSTIR
jgi:hypothetical protein